MNDSPQISVVIPVQNRATTLHRCIRSVLDQTFSDFEIIVVDDCSTDDSVQIVQGYLDPRISVYALQDNHGAAFCRNYGVAKARGNIIAFQDSDDVWQPKKLEKQFSELQAANARLSITRFRRHGYGAKKNGVAPALHVRAGFLDFRTVLEGDLVAMPTVMAEKALLIECPFDDTLRWCEDFEWSIRVSQITPFYLVGDVLTEVYLQSNSVTVVNTDKQLPFFEKMLREHQNIMESYSWFKADVLGGYAKQRNLHGDSGANLYRQAFQTAHRPKDLAKWLLSAVGLVGLFYRD